MPKVQAITTNFTAGEQSPRLRGRVDLEKYNSSAQELLNCIVLKQGAASIRPPTKFIAEVKDSTKAARLVPFVYSRTDSYLLELGEQYMRVFKSGVPVLSGPSPYEVATPYLATELAALEYGQGADTMLLASGTRPVQALLRYRDDRWTMGGAQFRPPPVAETGDRSVATMSISSGAIGSGRTITASSL